jgi:hypothetical protein
MYVYRVWIGRKNKVTAAKKRKTIFIKINRKKSFFIIKTTNVPLSPAAVSKRVFPTRMEASLANAENAHKSCCWSLGSKQHIFPTTPTPAAMPFPSVPRLQSPFPRHSPHSYRPR